MSEMLMVAQRARVDALRSALKAVEGGADALVTLKTLVQEAEEALEANMAPVGSVMGLVQTFGVVVEYTDESHPNGRGYILSNDYWVRAGSLFAAPMSDVMKGYL